MPAAAPDWTVIAVAVAASVGILAAVLAWWRRPRRPAGDPAEAEAIAATLERRALRQGRILPDGDADHGAAAGQRDAHNGAGHAG
jgi:hypothetical protein